MNLAKHISVRRAILAMLILGQTIPAWAEDMSRYRRSFYTLSPAERHPYFMELSECAGVLEGLRTPSASLFTMSKFASDVEIAFLSMPSLDPGRDSHWKGVATPQDRETAIAAGKAKASAATNNAAKQALFNHCQILKENYRAMVTDDFKAVRDG